MKLHTRMSAMRVGAIEESIEKTACIAMRACIPLESTEEYSRYSIMVMRLGMIPNRAGRRTMVTMTPRSIPPRISMPTMRASPAGSWEIIFQMVGTRRPGTIFW